MHSAYSLLEGALHHHQDSPSWRWQRLSRARRSPTPTTCSARWSSPTSWPRPACSRSSAAPCRVDFARQRAALAAPRRARRQRSRRSPPAGAIALLRRNEAGYANLMKLARAPASISRATTSRRTSSSSDLEALAGGLIALTGGPDGPIDARSARGQPDWRVQRLKTAGEDLRRPPVRRAPAPRPASREGDRAAAARPRLRARLPIVATNECYFASPDDYEAHDALLCIAEGTLCHRGQPAAAVARALLQDRRGDGELFADLPEALANTVEIAKRCAFRPKGRKPILPRFVAAASGAERGRAMLAAGDGGAAHAGRGRPRASVSRASQLAPRLHRGGLRQAA